MKYPPQKTQSREKLNTLPKNPNLVKNEIPSPKIPILWKIQYPPQKSKSREKLNTLPKNPNLVKNEIPFPKIPISWKMKYPPPKYQSREKLNTLPKSQVKSKFEHSCSTRNLKGYFINYFFM